MEGACTGETLQCVQVSLLQLSMNTTCNCTKCKFDRFVKLDKPLGKRKKRNYSKEEVRLTVWFSAAIFSKVVINSQRVSIESAEKFGKVLAMAGTKRRTLLLFPRRECFRRDRAKNDPIFLQPTANRSEAPSAAKTEGIMSVLDQKTEDNETGRRVMKDRTRGGRPRASRRRRVAFI